jgi:iron complex transport system ATP-binding protein
MTYVGADLHPEFPLTAHEAVRMGRICHGGTSSEDPEVRKAMEMTFCWTLRDRDLHTLSGGERQLVSLARAIAQGSRILLLDEALSRMDLNHQAEIGRLLRKLAAEGLSIILVAHDVNLASEWADTAVLLKGGKTLARGKMAEVLTEATVRELYPSVALSVGKNPITGTPKIFFGAKK